MASPLTPLIDADPRRLAQFGVSLSQPDTSPIDAARFDNRPSWDNNKPQFDNRPAWDNWSNKSDRPQSEPKKK